MENCVKISFLAAFMMLGTLLYSQSDSLGMPGDNLDLNAVLSLFKESSNVEDFEKRLNAADSKVNNLDLNGDEQVDYLRVVDYGKGDFHSIVIQDPVSKTESHDVAVIEIEKKDDKTAHIQIVGDETLYGKDYIIEPKDQPQTSDKKGEKIATDDVYTSPNSNNSTAPVVNVWVWPSVTYIYSPSYTYWVSPWYWGYYPGWYSPWRPYGWHVYHRHFIGYNYGFYGHRTHIYAFPRGHNYYYGRRTTSGYVQKNAYNNGRRNTEHNGENRSDRSRSNSQTKDRINNDQNRKSNSDRINTGDRQKQSGGERKRESSPRINKSGGRSGNSGGGGGRKR